MRAKTFTLIAILVAYALLGLAALANYVIDPFEAHGSGLIKPVQEQVNQRIYKLDVVDRRHAEFDSYILGSSRMQNTPPDLLEHYIPGAHFYNLSFTLNSVTDELKALRHLVARHYTLNHIYFEIDLDSPAVPETGPVNFLGRPPFPGQDEFPLHRMDVEQGGLRYDVRFIDAYDFQLVWGPLLNKLALRNTPTAELYFATTGMAHWVKFPRLAHENYPLFMQQQFPGYSGPARREGRVQDIPVIMGELTEFVNICRDNHIDCKIFTTPLHHYKLNDLNRDYVVEFLRELSQITDYWNFAYNSITTDNNNYYEQSHYRPSVQPLIAARIFADKSVPVPADFGTYVTKETFPIYEKILQQQFTAHDNQPLSSW